MHKNKSKLTLFFENSFWVAIYERSFGKDLEVSKIIFAKEPKDYEIYSFLLDHWKTLPFSQPIQISKHSEIKINPKRMQRLIKKELQSKGAGTKAQQALKNQQTNQKAARKKISRQEKEEQQQKLFKLKQQKRKQKHKGH